jgi:gamma-glutamyltranspeptidase
MGVLLNDEFDDFTAKRGVGNVYGLMRGGLHAPAPMKRLLSPMSPALAFGRQIEPENFGARICSREPLNVSAMIWSRCRYAPKLTGAGRS